MDKNAIKKFAVWARRELISRVSQRAAWYGITENDPIDEKAAVLHGKVLSDSEQAQRRALIARIRTVGFQQVMEEVAYTWFNRFIALRFMEVNGYLPSYTRVFSDDSGAFNPQILKDAIHLDLDGLDMEKVYALEEADETEALFKYLVITQCNDLNRMLPAMFERIADYTELLFPDFLLREGSVAHQMVTTIPEDDWKDAVQIIGWLYQYYNAEPKDEVFAALKNNIKISKEKIPAATQLFTPDWIVRYMVENSLGRLWVEGHPNDELKAGWKYYLEEAPQEPEVEAQLATIRAEYAQIDPASILCADPCMGSGHILVYIFDVLMQIYLSYGYTTNEAVESIVLYNLWGMDIDDRAAQLAYFAVMMKAQQYDHRWLAKQVRNPIQPHVFALQDSGDWITFERQMRQAFANHPSLFADPAIKVAKNLFDTFADAKEYGSIIQPGITLDDLAMLETVLNEMQQQANLMDFAAQADAITLTETLKPLIQECKALVQKYHVVVTNPPYMTNGSMTDRLSKYVQKYYEDTRRDLFAVFIARCMNMTAIRGYQAMITQQSWMFINSYENLRHRLVTDSIIVNMVQLGSRAFEEISGEVVQTTAFVINAASIARFTGTYVRLVDYDDSERKRIQFENHLAEHKYFTKQSDFEFIPKQPIAYWLKESTMKDFSLCKGISDEYYMCYGLLTGHDEGYIFYWPEISYGDILFDCESVDQFQQSKKKYAPLCKGGLFRRWYGNYDLVVRYDEAGIEGMSHYPKYASNGQHKYFKPGITWAEVCMGHPSMRYMKKGCIFSLKSPSIFEEDQEKMLQLLGFLNTNVATYFVQILNPTISCGTGVIGRLLTKGLTSVNTALVKDCINISQDDWDSFETSWDFQMHPLVRNKIQYRFYKINDDGSFAEHISYSLEDTFDLWKQECDNRFKKLKANEEELNRIFIGIYNLQDELTPDIDEKDVTIRKADPSRDIRSLISYAVGCMLGRYSLDKPGLVFAGGTWDESQYVTYHTDHDGILPITDDEYFDDDIVSMFVDFVRTVYGPEALEANLQFIAKALGGSGAPRDVIRQYFLNDFYKDHLKVYQKRPIYWLFDSGKKNGFKCLIYMQRYQPDTIARIRTDYLHEIQSRYRNAIETLERQSSNAATNERVKMARRLTALKAQAEEARIYEEKVHHLADQMIKIDLDDGVKVNYAKFADILAPIK